MHILVSTTTASDLAETAEQSIDYLQKIVDYMISKAHILISALIILIVGWYLTKFICKLVRHSLDKTRLDASVTSFINSLTKFGLRALLAIIVINKLGVDTTSLIALLTSASLAIGLAVQGSLANFAGGVLILIFKPFKVGDYIVACGDEGTVVGIDVFYTKLATVDNKMIVIPNGTLANSSVKNVSTMDKRRVDIQVGISYEADIAAAKSVLMEIIEKDGNILKDKPINVFVASLDASQVTLETRVWVSSEKYWDTKWALTEQYKLALDAAGIEIPFNQLSVTIKGMEEHK